MSKAITSREYKLMLKVERFENLELGVKEFWGEVMALAEKQEGTIPEPDQDEIVERQTWYLDTAGFDLRTHHKFVLRLRKEKRKTVKGEKEKNNKRKYKVTLKYRDPIREESARQKLCVSQKVKDSVRKKDIKTKFEKDILPSKSIFSHSTSVEQKKLPDLGNINEVVAFFPGIKTLGFPGETPIETVNGFKAYELAYRVGKLDFTGTVNACLSFWYPSEEKEGLPLAAEFSFDYDSEVKGRNNLIPKWCKQPIDFLRLCRS